MRDDRRSDPRAAGQRDLFGDLVQAPVRRPAGARAGVVGGRRPDRGAPAGGGGYLDGRTAAEVRQDIRLRELAEIGLSSTWLAVSNIVGYEAFVSVWRYLSANPALRNDSGQVELHLRSISAYERYQRNRYIETLVSAGLNPSQIRELVRAELGERLSFRHIHRLTRAARVRE